MRNPRFKEIKPNYQKNTLEITLQEGKKPKNTTFLLRYFETQRSAVKIVFHRSPSIDSWAARLRPLFLKTAPKEIFRPILSFITAIRTTIGRR
jgi:hypothetical protein